MAPRRYRPQTHSLRLDQVLAESRLIRSEARALNVREQLWELHGVLRQREVEDTLLRRYADQRSERIGSSLAARRAGM
jgi:hypothetical protein